MTTIFFDVETAPTTLAWVWDDIKVEPPGNYKKPESIKKWMDENAESVRREKILKTALDTSLAQIICIGYAIEDSDVVALAGEEESMLSAFFDAIGSHRSVTLVGHNILSFDIPLVYHRGIIHRLRNHNFHMHHKPLAGKVFDTMAEWAGYRDRISLDKLCKILGIPGKGDIDGSMVPELYAAGKIDKIKEYCADDVEKVRQIYNRLTTG